MHACFPLAPRSDLLQDSRDLGERSSFPCIGGGSDTESESFVNWNLTLVILIFSATCSGLQIFPRVAVTLRVKPLEIETSLSVWKLEPLYQLY
jgi:hypothetical protein